MNQINYSDPFRHLEGKTRLQCIRALQEEFVAECTYYFSIKEKEAGSDRLARYGIYPDGAVWAVWDSDSSEPDTLEWHGPFESAETASAWAKEKALRLQEESESWLAAEEEEKRHHALRPGKNRTRIEIELDPVVFETLKDLLQHSNGPFPEYLKMIGVKELIEEIAGAWADGWKRPGSWERQMLRSMGHAE